MGTVTMTFQNFGTSHCQNSASLGTSVSSMANITLSLVDLTELPCQPCHTFSHHVDPPLQNPLILSFKI